MPNTKKVDRISGAVMPRPPDNSRAIRNRQATAMLEVSLALLDVKRHAENGGSMEDLSYNLEALARYLRDSAL